MEPLLLTPSQAAKAIGVGRSTLYELLAHGELESVRIGALRRIPAMALADYVDRLRARAVATDPWLTPV